MKLSVRSLLVGASAAAVSEAQSCASGAHIIGVRGSGEAVGFGSLGAVRDQVLQQIPGSDAFAVPYPATIFPPDTIYYESVQQGVGNFTEALTQYVDQCPDTPIVLMGYSQGAHVIGDTLIGSDFQRPDRVTDGIDQRYVDRISAIVLTGDPTFTANQTYDVGNGTRGGVFPRENFRNWITTGLAERMQSYCDANDRFCDSGDSLDVHAGYIQEYGTRAAAFIVDTLQNSSSAGNVSTSTQTETSSSDSNATGTEVAAEPTTTGGLNAGTSSTPSSATTTRDGSAGSSPTAPGSAGRWPASSSPAVVTTILFLMLVLIL